MTNGLQKWLSIWGWGVFVFGLVLAGGAFGATDGIIRALFSLFDNPWGVAPDAHNRFAVGLMGAVTMGWGLTYLVAFKALAMIDAAIAAPLWKQLIGYFLVWYVVDCVISIATGFWMNVITNTIVTALLLIPLWRAGMLKS